MAIKRLLEVIVRAVLSVIFAGIFYTGWMAFAIPVFKSEFGGLALKAVTWILAPILTGLGFSAGSKIFELLPTTCKTSFLEIYKWCLTGCVIGAGIVWVFGPMLIVFGMFIAGTMSVVLHEVVRIRKEVVNDKAL
jgi:hypothetical protein